MQALPENVIVDELGIDYLSQVIYDSGMSTIKENELKVVEKEVNPIINKVRGLEIKDGPGLVQATELLSQLNQWTRH